jgi:hypothetical protein
MTPDNVASGGIPHPCVQSYPDGLVVPGAGEPSPSYNPTIDPRLLAYEDHGLLPQHNVPQITLSIPEGSYFELTSPSPSTSAPVWMGYSPGEEPSPLVHSPNSSLLDSLVSADGEV